MQGASDLKASIHVMKFEKIAIYGQSLSKLSLMELKLGFLCDIRECYKPETIFNSTSCSWFIESNAEANLLTESSN